MVGCSPTRQSRWWASYGCQEGYEAAASRVAHKRCQKLVKDMHYEARVQVVVTFHAVHLGVKMKKTEVRNLSLTREQYMQVPPYWCANKLGCWAAMVDKWCDPQWEETHQACRERRLMMPGAAHHQGSCLEDFRDRWSSAHSGQPCSQLKAWALAHKGKAMTDIDYNPDDPPSAYSNATIQSRLSEYTSMAREVHGPEWDPSTQDIDGEVVMRVGGGKKHGRYWLGDSILDTASTPTLPEIRARSTSSGPGIRPRPGTAQAQMEALQAQLEEERKRREEIEQRTAQMYQWMQTISERMGAPLPPMQFSPPLPPPMGTPNQSAGSNVNPNDQDRDLNPSPW